jgi:hypothetical protein
MLKIFRESRALMRQAPILSIAVLAGVWSLNFPVEAKRQVLIPGQRAIVIDDRLSALRSLPDLKAPLEQRLSRGRAVGVIGGMVVRNGLRFTKIAVSRNRQGWILTDAIVQPGNARDAKRLLDSIEEVTDDFTKAKLARLCADEFRATKFAPRALLLLGEAAQRAAEKLSRDARRRLADLSAQDGQKRRAFFLTFSGLDRYNRIGVTFDYDQSVGALIYDGRAYRELLRRYPRSQEANEVRERQKKIIDN